MGSPQYQYAGLILIMSGYSKISVHVNRISISKNSIKIILGIKRQKDINYL